MSAVPATGSFHAGQCASMCVTRARNGTGTARAWTATRAFFWLRNRFATPAAARKKLLGPCKQLPCNGRGQTICQGDALQASRSWSA
eukprot:15448123-Alexandrium_andersonii.AAC.1